MTGLLSFLLMLVGLLVGAVVGGEGEGRGREGESAKASGGIGWIEYGWAPRAAALVVVLLCRRGEVNDSSWHTHKPGI